MKVEFIVRQIAESRGIANPFALHTVSGVNYAICHRIWHSDSKLISLETLARLCDALNCSPGDLLACVPNENPPKAHQD